MYVLKHPNPYTLASIVYDEKPDEEWETMTELEFNDWKTQEIANGWKPQEDIEIIRKVWSSSADFWAVFTNAEKLAILSSTISDIILLREELRLWSGEVWSDDDRVQMGLYGLVMTGIITEERKTTILALQFNS